jgi:hypothetical protein
MKRRNFLTSMAIAPVAGQKALADAASRLAGSSGLAVLGGNSVVEPGGLAGGGPTVVKDMADFLLKRTPSWKARARYIHSVDPDLLALHLPLATLFRMQRERNYERIKADEEMSFTNTIKRFGKFEFWE